MNDVPTALGTKASGSIVANRTWARHPVHAGWRDYHLKTDPIGRHIPVFRLKPR